VEHLLRDVANSSGAPSSSLLTTQSLSTRVAAQLNALEGLSSRLADIADYLVAVQQGKLTVNHQIIYHIQEIMGLLPQLGGNLEVGKAFRMENNDSGLVIYISHMIRTILALHDLSGF
jgi:26S proteasome regulatory subunit N8